MQKGKNKPTVPVFTKPVAPTNGRHVEAIKANGSTKEIPVTLAGAETLPQEESKKSNVVETPSSLDELKPYIKMNDEEKEKHLAEVMQPTEPKGLSLEDKFLKMDTLYSLREKHEKLTDSLTKLNKFRITRDERSDNITLKDGNGNTFTTFNPEVLQKVIEWLKEDLTAKLKEVESQINF